MRNVSRLKRVAHVVALLLTVCVVAALSCAALLDSLLAKDSRGATSVSLFPGKTDQLIATGHYTNGTTMVLTNQVTWVSSSPSSVTVNAGLVQAVSVTTAPVSITATAPGKGGTITSNAFLVTVVAPALQSITVTGPGGETSASTSVGGTVQLTATGNYSDGTTKDITSQVSWISADPTTASVSSTGVVTGVAGNSNPVNIDAMLSGVTSNSFAVTVTAPTSCVPAQNNLCGQFLIEMQGRQISSSFAPGTPFVFVGSVNIQNNQVMSGIFDMNSASGPVVGMTVLSSAVTFDVNNLFTLQLMPQTGGPITIAGALDPAGDSGTVIRFDGATSNIQASGTITMQKGPFSASQMTGWFTVLQVGDDSNGVRKGQLGMFISTGVCDLNSPAATLTTNVAGAVTGPSSFTGSCMNIDAMTGRGTGMFNFGSSSPPENFSFYVGKTTPSGLADTVRLVSIDTMAPGIPAYSGEFRRQNIPTGASGFSSSDLNCGQTGPTNLGCVAEAQGVTPSGTASAAITLMTQSPSSPGVVTLAIQQNAGGVFTSNTVPASYTFNVWGVGVIDGMSAVLTDINQGKTLSLDASVSVGYFMASTATGLPNGTSLVSAYNPIPTVQTYVLAGFVTLSGNGMTAVSASPTVFSGSILMNNALAQGSGRTLSMMASFNSTTGQVSGSSDQLWLPTFVGYPTDNGVVVVPNSGATRPIILSMHFRF